MTNAQTTAYLVAVRAWFDAKRRAAMAGEPFNQPMPERAIESKPCEHPWVTSTFETGPMCAECREPLVSLFHPLSRNTTAGALLYAMRKAA